MNKNRNYNYVLNPIYQEQQQTISEICSKYGLILYYPDYHAKDNDCNTVLIYTKEAAEYNTKLEIEYQKKYSCYPSSEEYKKYICSFTNTDINGHFSYDFMNNGKIDLRSLNYKENIGNYIKKFIEEA